MDSHVWGLPVTLDLFFAGLGAGAFCFSVLAGRRTGAGFDACSRMGAFLTPCSLAFGMLMLIIDLRYPSRFWFTMGVFNYQSPMSIGVWLLSLFALLSVIYAIFWVPSAVRSRIPLLGRWSFWDDTSYRKRVGAIGVPFALAVSVYTGVLLSASALPLWRNVALSPLFCFSALSTGFAGGAILAMAGSRGFGEAALMDRLTSFLRQGLRPLLSFYLLAVAAFLALLFGAGTPRQELLALLAGWNGALWWLGTIGVGILLPLGIMFRKGRMSTASLCLALAAILIGGFLLRFTLVTAGQLHFEAASLLMGYINNLC
jgi:formate-dependent nitrite reductase membrane component NrfD